MIRIPKPKANPDFTELKELCADYMKEVRKAYKHLKTVPDKIAASHQNLPFKKESFDLVTAPIIFTGKISVDDIANQIDWFLVATTPPADQIHRNTACLGETNLRAIEYLPFLK